MLDRRKARQLLGESLREVAILVLVFIPVDALFETGRVNPWGVVAAVAGGLLFVGVGIIVEADV